MVILTFLFVLIYLNVSFLALISAGINLDMDFIVIFLFHNSLYYYSSQYIGI